MHWHRRFMLLTLALLPLAWLLDGALTTRASLDWLPTGSARVYAERALRTQRFTERELSHWAGGESCPTAYFLGLRRAVGSPLSDSWYAASQLQADAALRQLGQTGHDCRLLKTVTFLDFVARGEGEGGYWPRASIVGRDISTRDTYSDDNALIGLALLAAREASTEPEQRGTMLVRAERAAHFLIAGGVWDDTFGGGFWWNTERGKRPEGKPAQTTGLAVQLFVRLYQLTGRTEYATWARRGLVWLDGRLLDPASGLYRYTVRHWDLANQSGEYLEPRAFSYDQGIMIEVHVIFDQVLAPGQGHLERARQLAGLLQTQMWDPDRGGYHLETDSTEIYSGYSAWLTQSLLALEAVDPNPEWLRRAQANLDALEAWARDPVDGGYVLMQYPCISPTTPGCELGAAWSYDPTRLLLTQSWMQRAQALLARRLATIGR